METNLPDFHSVPTLRMNLMRTSTFDQLHGLLQRGRCTWSHEKMKMIRHHNKFMKLGSAFVAADEYPSNQDFCNFRHSE